MSTLHIWPEEPTYSQGEIQFRALFEGLPSGSQTIEFAVPEAALRKIPSRMDHFALAGLFPAMRESDVCILHGPVSMSLLANISELNAIWRVWRPDVYHHVDWKSDQPLEDPTVAPCGVGHLFAFSGGVDASATLLRHSDERLGWRKLVAGAAVLVHGFDIVRTDQEGFNHAFVQAERITSSLGVPLVGVRTNIRALPANWEDACAANVASVLHLFSECFEGGVFASDEPYRFPVLPWGSNPVSNPFLGTSSFPVRTDGAELTRLEKVQSIARNEAVVQNLRVCWEGKLSGKNCGVCEKCVRTQLELAACGMDHFQNFGQKFSPGLILNIRPRNEIQLSFLTEVLEYADRNKISAWWTRELRNLVRRGIRRPSARFRSLRRTRLWQGVRKYVRKS